MSYAEINHTKLYYQATGNGTPIVFLHPPLLSSANFHYQQKELSEKFKVVTFDFRGHGRSSSGDIPLTYPLIIEDTVALLKYLQIKEAYIAGYSTGASIALEALKKHNTFFSGGILMSAMISPTSLYIQNLIRLAAIFSNKLTFSLLARAICNGNADCPSTYKLLLEEAIKGNTKKIKEYYKYSLSFSYQDKIKNITKPILMLNGDKDDDFFQTKTFLQEKLPTCTSKTINNVSHQIPTKAAQFVNTSIAEFIRYQS